MLYYDNETGKNGTLIMKIFFKIHQIFYGIDNGMNKSTKSSLTITEQQTYRIGFINQHTFLLA